MTHNEQILKILTSGVSLTQLEALHLVGTSRLAARISNLESMGHVITHTPVVVKVRDGKNARVMSYRIEVAA
jgi:hypothetical protein